MIRKPISLTISSSLKRELAELSKAFGETSETAVIRRTITNKALREVLRGARIIHFAGHGEAPAIYAEDFEGLNESAQPKPVPTLILSALVVPEAKVADGLRIQAITISWREIVRHLERDWSTAYEIPSEKWEEIVAGAFKKEGYDEVILTPRSGDDGRDVIAIRKGIGTVKILGSIKAYGPGRLVRHDDVRALVGVMAMEPDSSKGIITTTSDFAPNIYTNPRYKALMPTRLETVNGEQLQRWLVALANAPSS